MTQKSISQASQKSLQRWPIIVSLLICPVSIRKIRSTALKTHRPPNKWSISIRRHSLSQLTNQHKTPSKDFRESQSHKQVPTQGTWKWISHITSNHWPGLRTWALISNNRLGMAVLREHTQISTIISSLTRLIPNRAPSSHWSNSCHQGLYSYRLSKVSKL